MLDISLFVIIRIYIEDGKTILLMLMMSMKGQEQMSLFFLN